ncbi:hypothetical protein LT493_25815 [Streptomyces tricolor]|nr:hypothetical protein [Streptomyces tricolor]
MTTGLARAQIRSRPSAFVGTFVALLFGALVIICCGHLLFAAADADQAPQRYAAVPVLVAADPEADGRPVPDRARVDVSLAGRIAALPQVKAAVADTAFPVTVSAGHRAPVVADGRPVSTVRFAAAGGDATPPALAAGRLALDAGTARELGAVRGTTLRVTASEGTASLPAGGGRRLAAARGVVRGRRGVAFVRPPEPCGRHRRAAESPASRRTGWPTRSARRRARLGC